MQPEANIKHSHREFNLTKAYERHSEVVGEGAAAKLHEDVGTVEYKEVSAALQLILLVPRVLLRRLHVHFLWREN